jgi:hypothetical protein
MEVKYIIIGVTLLIVSYMVTISYMQTQRPNHFGHFTKVLGDG